MQCSMCHLPKLRYRMTKNVREKKKKKMTKTQFAEFLYTKWTGVVSNSRIFFRYTEDHSRDLLAI